MSFSKSKGPHCIGRPVRILTICFPVGSQNLTTLTKIILDAADSDLDLIVLPEYWQGQDSSTLERIDGESVCTLSAIAKRLNCYLVTPIDCLRESGRFNTSVVIGRSGEIVGFYDKHFPYWDEFDIEPPVVPGRYIPVFELDFGNVGIATCFDINFPEVWNALATGGAEIVVWPSAYSGGRALQAHATNHHYYIITATHTGDTQLYDITGEKLLDTYNEKLNISHVEIDLDRGIYHENFNMGKLSSLIDERGEDLAIENRLEREQWFVLRATRPNISVRELARSYGLEELRNYVARSGATISMMGGEGPV